MQSSKQRTLDQIYKHKARSTKCSLIRVCWCGRSLPEINVLFTKPAGHHTISELPIADCLQTLQILQKRHIICYVIISDFIPFFSQFGSQSHPYFFNYPPMLFLDPPHTPRPWRPREDLAIPESDTPSSSRILSPICRNSRCPRRF